MEPGHAAAPRTRKMLAELRRGLFQYHGSEGHGPRRKWEKENDNNNTTNTKQPASDASSGHATVSAPSGVSSPEPLSPEDGVTRVSPTGTVHNFQSRSRRARTSQGKGSRCRDGALAGRGITLTLIPKGQGGLGGMRGGGSEAWGCTALTIKHPRVGKEASGGARGLGHPRSP